MKKEMEKIETFDQLKNKLDILRNICGAYARFHKDQKDEKRAADFELCEAWVRRILELTEA